MVDDCQDMRELWCDWLGSLGFAVEEACNGLEGVQQALKQPPDLVLMDVRMPLMDGFEATRRLRADVKTAGAAILVLSAEPGAQGGARESGCDRFLRKPITPDELLRHIREVLGTPRLLLPLAD